MAAHNLLRRTAIISQTRPFSSRRNFHSSQPKCLNDSDNKKEPFIIMDFGNDIHHRPPPLQVLDACLHSCSKLVRSLEEAKRRISECNTTTYTGFQGQVDRDTSNKFQTLPGVIIVLPNSYMDPVKEYGGDKYINGATIPRPPPGRYFRTDNQRPWDSMPQQGNPPYYQHNSMPHETRSYPPQVPHQGFLQQQNSPPQHNYGPSSGPHIPSVRDGYQGGQSDRVASMPSGPQNPGLGRDGYHFLPPPQQGNYNQDYSHRQGQMNNHGGNAPSGQYRSDSVDYGYNHPQPQRGNIPGDHGGYAPPGQMGFSGGNRSNSQHSITGVYEQTGHGSFEQSGNGQYGQRPNGNNDHGPRSAPCGERQRLLPTSNEQKNPPRAPTGFSDDPLLFD